MRKSAVVEPALILSGWKDIAGYLGKGVRTVQRYERELALPVRRPAGKPAGSVIATKSELDAWISARPIRENFDVAKPLAVTQGAISASAIRDGVAEMKKLRAQMLDLQNEVKAEMHGLREKIASLRLEVEADTRVTNPAGARALEKYFGFLDTDDMILSDAAITENGWRGKAAQSLKLTNRTRV